MSVMGPTKIVMAWYKRAQWPRLREVSADPSRLAEGYDEWLSDANRQLQEMRGQGLLISRVIVDVEELVAWCAQRGRKVEPAAASEYAAAQAQQGRGMLDW